MPPLAGAVAILAALSAACASTGTPRPLTPASLGAPPAEMPPVESGRPPVAEPAVPAARRASNTIRALIDTAMNLRGVRYRPGGSDPTGFDCSGFTRWVFGQLGIDLPRSVSEQIHEGKAIKRRDITAGDLLFFRTEGRSPTHVAISIDGEQFVHAPASNGVVRVESLDTTYWSSRFVGARRVR